LLLIIPAVSPIGALFLLCVDAGAFLSQVAVLHGDWIHTVVIAVLLLLILYLQRNEIRGKLALWSPPQSDKSNAHSAKADDHVGLAPPRHHV